jgi:hypothetical protein
MGGLAHTVSSPDGKCWWLSPRADHALLNATWQRLIFSAATRWLWLVEPLLLTSWGLANKISAFSRQFRLNCQQPVTAGCVQTTSISG